MINESPRDDPRDEGSLAIPLDLRPSIAPVQAEVHFPHLGLLLVECLRPTDPPNWRSDRPIRMRQ